MGEEGEEGKEGEEGGAAGVAHPKTNDTSTFRSRLESTRAKDK